MPNRFKNVTITNIFILIETSEVKMYFFKKKVYNVSSKIKNPLAIVTILVMILERGTISVRYSIYINQTNKKICGGFYAF